MEGAEVSKTWLGLWVEGSGRRQRWHVRSYGGVSYSLSLWVRVVVFRKCGEGGG